MIERQQSGGKMQWLAAQLCDQQGEAERFDAVLAASLKEHEYGG